MSEELEKVWRKCLQCDSDFYIKEADQEFFKLKNLELPKRCWTCRQKNRKEAMEARMRQAEADRIARLNGKLRTGRSPVDKEMSPGKIVRKR